MGHEAAEKASPNVNPSVIGLEYRLTREERYDILDLAPGNCVNVRYLVHNCHNVKVYLDENPIQTAKALLDFSFAEITLVKITDCLPESQFDAILAIHALINISPQRLKYLIRYIERHTKPGGYLALTTKLNHNFFSRWKLVKDEYTGKDKIFRHTESLNLRNVVEQLLRKPRK